MNTNRRFKKADETTILTDDWQAYERCRDYLAGKNFYRTVDMSYRFYMGDQWGSDAPKDIPKPQINIIRRQVDYKVATIMGNGMSLNFSNAEFKDRNLANFTERITAPLNNYIAKEWERNSMDDRLWQCSQDACISGAVGIYSYFDDKEDVIACELKSNTEILFADEQEKDIQKQKFIILPFRRPVHEVRAEAKANGIEEFKVQSIVADEETENEVGDYAKTEVDTSGEEDGKCLCLLKLYKDKDGKVCMRKSTRTVVYQPEVCTGLELYPIAWLTWNPIKGSTRGKGDVVEWIPNQVEINKNEAKRAIAVMMGAYPKLAYLTDRIQNPEAITEYGTAIGVEGRDLTDVTKAVGYLNATQMSPDAKAYVDELIERTQEMSGASQFALGNIDPAQTSGRAILAMRDASAVTLSMQQSKMKRFVEDIGRIWWDIWAAYSPNGKSIVHDEKEKRPVMQNGQPQIGNDGQPVMEEVDVQIVETIPPEMLKQIKFSVKVDVSPSNVFSKYAVEQTLENMLMNQQITFEEYVEALPEDSIAPKSKLIKIVEDRAVLQRLQAERDQAITERDQVTASYSQLANLMPILEQKGKEYLAKQGSNAKATDKTGAAT